MKKVKLFQHGRSQAVRLPKGFRFEGKEVYIKKTGNVVQLIPVAGSWDTFFGSLDKFSSDFMEECSQPRLENRESF